MADWKAKALAVLRGAAVAAAGAALTHLTAAVTGADFGPYTPAVVAVWSVAVNAARKALEAWASPAADSEEKPGEP